MALSWSSLYTSTALGRSLGYVNGNWISAMWPTGSTNKVEFPATTDPRGTWTAGTALTLPSGGYENYWYAGNTGEQFQYDGTNYFIVAPVYSISLGNRMLIHYATSPTSSWNYYDAFGGFRPYAACKFGSTWVTGGGNSNGTANLTVTATDPLGTWTQVASESIIICSFRPEGNTLYRLVIDGSVTKVQSSTSASGSWTTRFTGPTDWYADYANARPGIGKHSNGYYTILLFKSSTLTYRCYYTTDPTSWSDYFEFTVPWSESRCTTFTYGYGYWVYTLGGTDSRHRIAYYQGSGSPDGTYTTAITPFGSNGGPYDGTFHAGEFIYVGDFKSGKIVGISGGQIPDPDALVIPTYLRQRQSPRRTPSRVRGVDLRQRQSPRIA